MPEPDIETASEKCIRGNDIERENISETSLENERKSQINRPELLLLEKNKDALPEAEDTDQAELTDREMEAHAAPIAPAGSWAKERSGIGTPGDFRPVHYGDIVILLRSLTGWGDVYARVLNAAGIPAHTQNPGPAILPR